MIVSEAYVLLKGLPDVMLPCVIKERSQVTHLRLEQLFRQLFTHVTEAGKTMRYSVSTLSTAAPSPTVTPFPTNAMLSGPLQFWKEKIATAPCRDANMTR